jgi:SPP1 gp7 family putative phage head morphogenesis protein
VAEPRELSDDPPVLVCCTGWTAVSPHLGRLEAAPLGPGEAGARALRLAAEGDGTALVFRGHVQLRSGSRLYVRARHVVDLDKARRLSPLNRRDFARIVDEVHRQLLRGARRAEREAMTRAAAKLKRRWNDLGPRATARQIEEVAQVVLGIARSPALARVVEGPLVSRALRVAADSRRAARKESVKPLLDVADRAAVARIGRDQTFWVMNEYGRRARAWARDAAPIIRDGLAQGLDARTIATDLQAALGRRVSGRSEAYFRTVANVAMTRGRSYGQLTGFRDGAVLEYQWSAVMDEVTCPVCAFLDGQIFSTSDAIARMARVEAAPSPDAAAAMDSFYSVRGDRIVVRSSGTEVARFRRDDDGAPTGFRALTPIRGTEGVTMPPAHEGCRCTLLPVL